MKNYKIVTLALAAVAFGASLNAENTQVNAATPAATQQTLEAVATKLSAEEQSFASKLSDQNRKAFSEQFTAEQRKVAMTAAKASTVANAADEVVAKLAQSAVVSADKKENVSGSVAEQTAQETSAK